MAKVIRSLSDWSIEKEFKVGVCMTNMKLLYVIIQKIKGIRPIQAKHKISLQIGQLLLQFRGLYHNLRISVLS